MNRQQRRRAPKAGNAPATPSELNARAVALVTLQRQAARGQISSADVDEQILATFDELRCDASGRALAWLLQALSGLAALALTQWQHDHPADDPDRWLQALALANALELKKEAP